LGESNYNMENNSRITIFLTDNYIDIIGLQEEIDKLRVYTDVNIEKSEYPAALGELAGIATEILLSKPIQTVANAAQVGTLLWTIIKIIKSTGKSIYVSKAISRLLILAKFNDDHNKEIDSKLDKMNDCVEWGPMTVSNTTGVLYECESLKYDAIGPPAYFMAIALPIKNNVTKMVWYIMNNEGEICATWNTQTKTDRLPDFLKKGEE